MLDWRGVEAGRRAEYTLEADQRVALIKNLPGFGLWSEVKQLSFYSSFREFWFSTQFTYSWLTAAYKSSSRESNPLLTSLDVCTHMHLDT